MAEEKKPTSDFIEILDKGAEVDDIFKDNTQIRGANPFKISPADLTLSGDENTATLSHRLAVVEELFKLIAKDHLSFGQLVSEVLRIAMEHVKSEAGSILEMDYTNQCLFFRAVAGRSSENLLSFTIPNGQGIAGFVCQSQQPMHLSSIDDTNIYLRTVSDAVGFETRNLICYPIIIRGNTFGCIELLNRLGETQFTDNDREVMATVVTYAAKVIENRLLIAAISKEAETVKGENAA